MGDTTQRGRRRHDALFAFLNLYPWASTAQLARAIWGGNEALARRYLLRFHQEGHLRREPHPRYRNGAYCYTARSQANSTHSQKILHHLAEVDFHLAVISQLGRYGARVIPELSWAPSLIPDQTVLWKDTVFAVEHHLTGRFGHSDDYRQFIEEESFTLCAWWRDGIRIGLLVITAPMFLEHVRGQLKAKAPPELVWRVATRDSALQDPGAWLKIK